MSESELLTLYCTHEDKVEELSASRAGSNCEEDAICPKCVLGEEKGTGRELNSEKRKNFGGKRPFSAAVSALSAL